MDREEQPGLEVAPSNGIIAKPAEYSDLQIPVSDLPIVRQYDEAGLEVSWASAKSESTRPHKHRHKGRRICGLSRRTLWVALIVGLLVVLAAVGGSVGGVVSVKGGSRSSKTHEAKASPLR
jgi:hypothetical protein